jgi:hypothetical protein
MDARAGDTNAKRADAAAQTGAAQGAQPAQKKSSLMSDQTRDALRRLAQSLRHAAGLEATPAASKPKAPEPKGAPAAIVPERRAEAPNGRGPRP